MRVAIVAIFIEEKSMASEVNEILHKYSKYIIGRMGLSKVEENLSVITVVIKAKQDIISAMSGQLGNLKKVVSKTTYAN